MIHWFNLPRLPTRLVRKLRLAAIGPGLAQCHASEALVPVSRTIDTLYEESRVCCLAVAPRGRLVA